LLDSSGTRSRVLIDTIPGTGDCVKRLFIQPHQTWFTIDIQHPSCRAHTQHRYFFPGLLQFLRRLHRLFIGAVRHQQDIPLLFTRLIQ